MTAVVEFSHTFLWMDGDLHLLQRFDPDWLVDWELWKDFSRLQRPA